MKKTTLIVLFSLFNFLFIHANHKPESYAADSNFDVTVSLLGEVFIEYHDYNIYKTNQWQFEYGPVGFQPGRGTVVTVTGVDFYKFKVNPLSGYDFRVRQQYLLDDFSGFAWTDWSQIKTIFALSDKVFSVGYSTNFNNKTETDSEWRGFIYKNWSSDAGVYLSTGENHSATNEPGSSMNMTNYNYQAGTHVALVSPKFNDLATDRKIKFWTYGYTSDTELLAGTMTNPSDLSTFHLLAPVEVKPGYGWQPQTIYFNNYKGTDQYIVFLFKRKYYGASNENVGIDDFSYETAANCFDQSNFAVSDVQQHSAKISFDAPNQDNFQVSLTNVVKHTTEILNIKESPFVLNNLVGNTNYEVKVRANCVDDLFSNWTPTISFKTPCTAISGSYTTSFEGTSYLDPCWNIISNNCLIRTSVEETDWSLKPLPKTGTSSILIYTFQGKINQDKAYLITPYIADLDSNTRIRFNLLTYSSADTYNKSSLTIGTMSDPKDQTTFIPLKTILPSEMNELDNPNKSALWKEHTVYLDNYSKSNNHNYIAIRYNNESNSIFSIDDFIYEKVPSCMEPLNPVTIDFDYDFAQVKWDSYKPASEWQVEYGPKGFSHGNGTLVNASASTIKLTEAILDDTEYDFYVRTKCGANYSDWSDKGYFRTKCLGITADFKEDFENTIFEKNGCWTRIVPYFDQRYFHINNFIKVNTAADWGTGSIYEGKKSMVIRNQLDVAYPPGVGEKTDKVVLVSPRIKDLDNYKKINFWMMVPTESENKSVELIIGTLSDPEDYTTFKTYQTITIPAANKSKWLNYEIDFSQYYGTDKFIGFKQSINNLRLTRIFIDNFTYTKNECPRPGALEAKQSGAKSVLLNWRDNNTNKVSQSWDIEYGLKGFANGTGTIVNVTTNPFNLTGLEQGIYEYRVRSYCETTIKSEWSDRYTFKVGCTVQAPFIENFDQYKNAYPDILNFCWTRSEPIYAQLQEYSMTNINSAPNVFYLQNREKDAFLISPYLEDFDSNKKIKFWLNYQMGDTRSKAGDLVIGTIKNPMDLSTFEPYRTITIQELKELPKYGKEFNIDFSEYKGENKHIMFKYLDDPADTFVSNTVLIDDIQYNQASSCYEPIDVVFSNVSNNSLNIHWTSKNESPQNVQIEYGITGFTLGSGTVLNTNENQISVSGLQTGSSYQFYFKTLCGSDKSLIVGPRKIETTCNIKALPWTEKFSNLSSYGKNILPDCFKFLQGDITMENKAVKEVYSNFGPDYMRKGFDDNTYLYINGYAKMMLPMFHLKAGTTYKFSLKGRNSYEYRSQGVWLSVGRGQNEYNMEASLTYSGRLTEYNYSDLSYYFTPVVSGDYSFLMHFYNSGSPLLLVDNFELREGYTSSINGNSTVSKYNFDAAIPEAIILEGTLGSIVKVDTDPVNLNNKVVALKGNSVLGEWRNSSDIAKKRSAADTSIWESNPSSISKINFKVDATNVNSLFMRFDLRQTFVNSKNESMFRVVVNGDVLQDIIQPVTKNGDTYETHVFDLSTYVKSDIRISLQHIGKSDLGDNAFLDNLVFNQTATLSVTDHNYGEFKYYPNPIENILNIEGNSIISNVEVYNLNGQLLSKEKYSDSKVVIDFRHYATGVYMIVLTQDDKKESFKVIKK